MSLTYWSYIGTVYMIILTFKDLKNMYQIPTKYNYVMVGLSISLLSHVELKLWYLLGLIIISILFLKWLSKNKLIGGADNMTLSWQFYGFGILGAPLLVSYVLVFAFLTVVQHVTKKILYKKDIRVPYMPVLLFTFIINCIVWGLY